jgi:hypothetical protein
MLPRAALCEIATSITRNAGLLLSVPVGVTTDTVPVVAPAGTAAVIKVSDSTVNVAAEEG